MSTKKERTKIAGIYQQAVVLQKDNRFNAGYTWGIHQALVALGLSVQECWELQDKAKEWEKESCPDLHECQAGCQLCGERFMK